ncbi:MAG: hypothetical protein AAGD01_17585 [Acidobacteriota bacterium]
MTSSRRLRSLLIGLLLVPISAPVMLVDMVLHETMGNHGRYECCQQAVSFQGSGHDGFGDAANRHRFDSCDPSTEEAKSLHMEAARPIETQICGLWIHQLQSAHADLVTPPRVDGLYEAAVQSRAADWTPHLRVVFRQPPRGPPIG